MHEPHLAIARRVALRFSQLPEVEAVCVAGSQMTHTASQTSDIDLFIYLRISLSAETRVAIALEFAQIVELVDFWGPGVEWNDPDTGVHVDTIYFTTDWTENQIDRVLIRHEAALGYTTALWHTVRISHILFDRDDWFAALQRHAMQDYPMSLVKAIVAMNYPILRKISSSYLHQLEKAAGRHDLVSLNHRTAALLASYFDILFAVNQVPHPGEKRLLAFAETLCPKRPGQLREQINAVLSASGPSGTGIVEAVNQLIDSLEILLANEGL
jgi:predicted nucleotidyltransferase